jgi:hypothetical protein
MATVKTTGMGATLRILTKTADGVQRVSCSCCEEEVCCPYPADQLGVGYTQDDLPDTIDVEGIILGVPTRIIVSRSGSFYGPINQSIFGGATFTEFIFVETNDFSEVVWFRNTTNGEPLGIGEPCLFQSLEEGAAILDTFADTYTYTVVFNGSTLESGTITRDSLCVWLSNTEQPFVVGIFYNSETFRFEQLDANDFNATKSGPSNSPAGEYVVAGGLYEGGILTVSE